MGKDKRTLTQKIIDIVASQLELEGSDKEEIYRGTILGDDLGADSLDLIEINMAIEDEFGVEIPDEAYGESDAERQKITIAHMVKVAQKYIEKEEPCEESTK